ncbi:MAG: FAD-binding oxidoreductase [Brevinematia bacterium]
MIDLERRFVEDCKVLDISPLGKYFEVILESKYISKYIKPGQFVNVLVKNVFFRRPFTLFNKDKNSFSILVKVVGRGTEEISNMKSGQFLNVLGPLGNSIFDFDLHHSESIDLVAGGVGIANMISVAKLFKTSNRKVRLFWGVKTKAEYFEKDFEYFDEINVSSEDGSIGEKGFVTEILAKRYTGNKIYSCGPIQMIKSISALSGLIPLSNVVCSLESVMGCGIGVCYGCSIGSPQSGYKLVCKDGPNFLLSEIKDFI